MADDSGGCDMETRLGERRVGAVMIWSGRWFGSGYGKAGES